MPIVEIKANDERAASIVTPVDDCTNALLRCGDEIEFNYDGFDYTINCEHTPHKASVIHAGWIWHNERWERVIWEGNAKRDA